MKSQEFYKIYFGEEDKKESKKIFIAAILFAIAFHLNLFNLPIDGKEKKTEKAVVVPVKINLENILIKEKRNIIEEPTPLPIKDKDIPIVIENIEPIESNPDIHSISPNPIDFNNFEIEYSNIEIPPIEEDNEIYIIDNTIIPPERLTEINPNYPLSAIKSKVEGYVVLQLVIDKEGNVIDCKVLKDAPFGLTEEAVKEAYKQKFKPAINKKTGLPVFCYYTLTIRFKLENTPK